MIKTKRLGVGFVGGGAAARSHLRSWATVRDADVVGAWSPDPKEAAEVAKPYRSLAAMIADSAIDALWLCGTTDTRVEYMEEIADAVIRAKGKVIGVASATPLAADVATARHVTALAAHAGLKHGYLEPEVFSLKVVNNRDVLWASSSTGRPRTVRAAATYAALPAGGPLQALGTGVLVTRYLLTRPGEFLPSLRPQHITGTLAGHSASITTEFTTADGARVSGEASASWNVGTTDHEDADGYRAVNQHYVDAFLGLVEPLLTFEDGLDVVRILTAADRSMKEGRAVEYTP